MDGEIKPTLPGKQGNGLSRQEQEWFANWLTAINTNLTQQTNYLRSMNTAIQIMAALVLISVIVAACSALFHTP